MKEFYINDDGIKLHAKLDMPEGLTKCPLAIVVHGYTGDMEEIHIAGAAKAFNESGFATLRVEMYGHGKSDGSFRDHTLYKWVHNMLKVVAYTKTFDFMTDLYLCGHSQGGLLVMLIAGMCPDRFKAIVPLSPAWMIPEEARKGCVLGTTFDPVNIPDEILQDGENLLGGDYIRTAQTIHVEDEIARYAGPVLIIHGDEDESVPYEYGVRAAGLYRNAKLVTIKGDDHCFDYHLDLVTGAIKEFCSREISADALQKSPASVGSDCDLSKASPSEVRQLIRQGIVSRQTSGMCNGYAQANLVILPEKEAADFLLFATKNPKACPLLEVTEKGSRLITDIADNADVATDLPGYRIYKRGELVTECTDISEYWRDDLVSFLIGCSFSFESEMMSADIPVRHIEEGRNVPMYNTNIACRSAGIFHGNMVVSMRPIPYDLIPKAVLVTGAMPRVHGAPVHIGSPEKIGINNINCPDYGEAVTIKDNEIPVFWACGVTPQAVVMASKPDFCITHAPGHMFISDIKNINLKY